MDIQQRLKYNNTRINAAILLKILLFMFLVWCELCFGKIESNKIPALGRTASLGQLYDGIRDDFIDISVFDRTKPINPDFIEHEPLSLTQISFESISTCSDRLKLLDIDFNSGLNILSKLTPVKGSASFLTDEMSSASDVTAAMLIKRVSFSEDLDLFSPDLKEVINKPTLEHVFATHLVTGITWGWTTVVKFSISNPLTSAHNISHHAQLSLLRSDLANLEGQLSQPNATKFLTFKSNFTAIVISDIVPTSISLSPEEIQQFLQTQLSLYTDTDTGKIIPQKFHLTPIIDVSNQLDIYIETNNNLLPISNWILKDSLTIFEDISRSQQKLIRLQEVMNPEHTCVHLHVNPNCLNFSKYCIDFYDKFKNDFQTALVHARSVIVTHILNLSSKYYEGECSPTIIEQQGTQCTVAAEKIKFCELIQNSYSSIQYFASNDNLWETIRSMNETDNSDSPIYILFKKTEFARNDPKVWEQNLNFFLDILYKPFNLLYIVDCDFDHLECQSVNGTVIKQIKYERFTINDVLAEVRKGIGANKPLKVKAFGRPALIGQLYNARTERFLERSILSPKHDPSLIHVTKFNSGNPKEFCKTEQVDEETQFNILAGLAPNTSAVMYFASRNQTDFEDTFFLTSYSKSEEISMNKSILANSFDCELLQLNPNVHGATHFVSRIEYGNDRVLFIQDTRLKTRYEIKLEVNNHKNLPGQIIQTILSIWNQEDGKDLKNIDTPTMLKTLNSKKFRLLVTSLTNQNQQFSKSTNIIETLEELREFFNASCYQLHSKSKVESVPVAYELIPISKLGSDVGLLIDTDTYQPLTSTGENPKTFAKYFENIDRANMEINQEILLRDENDCITHDDVSALEAFKQEYKNSVSTFRENFVQVCLKIKSGELLPEALTNLRLAFESADYFSPEGRYKKRDWLLPFRRKADFCKRIHNRSNIVHVGRDTSEFEFYNVILPEPEKCSEMYLLYYKPAWCEENILEWTKQSQYFFDYLTKFSRTDISCPKLYVVNCERDPPYCYNMTKSSIIHHQNGNLMTLDSFTIEEEQETKIKNKIEDLEKVVAEQQELLNSLLKNVESTGRVNTDMMHSLNLTINQHQSANAKSIEQLNSKQLSSERAIRKNDQNIYRLHNQTAFKEGPDYIIQSVATGLVLTLRHWNISNGASIVTKELMIKPNQKWRSKYAYADRWWLSTFGDKALDQDVTTSSGRGQLNYWDYLVNKTNHLWYTRLVSSDADVYLIISVANERAITSHGEGLVYRPTCQPQDLTNTAQHWKIIEQRG